MTLSLHEVVVPGFLQTLGAVAGLLDKVEAYCQETGTPAEEVLADRLAPDMRDFAYQVKSTAVHSWGAIEGVGRGVFGPDTTEPGDLAALRARIGAAQAGLEAVSPGELDAIAGRDMLFRMGSFEVPFTVTTFLLSFSTPNIHFHAATAYALLRRRGLPIGKVDYLGRMRTA